MKRVVVSIIALVMCVMFSSCHQSYGGNTNLYQDGYDAGFADGSHAYDTGYDDGYKDGRDSMLYDGEYISADDAYDAGQRAYAQGYSDGYSAGAEVGREDGYSDGFKDGYDTGWDDAHEGAPYTPEPHA